jgi:hypothetical protein
LKGKFTLFGGFLVLIGMVCISIAEWKRKQEQILKESEMEKNQQEELSNVSFSFSIF